MAQFPWYGTCLGGPRASWLCGATDGSVLRPSLQTSPCPDDVVEAIELERYLADMVKRGDTGRIPSGFRAYATPERRAAAAHIAVGLGDVLGLHVRHVLWDESDGRWQLRPQIWALAESVIMSPRQADQFIGRTNVVVAAVEAGRLTLSERHLSSADLARAIVAHGWRGPFGSPWSDQVSSGQAE